MSPTAWRTVLAVLLSCGVVGAAGWLVFYSPVLGVRDVAVTGNAVLADAEIRRAAAVRAGQPLATVDLATVRRRIAALPRVRSARVERDWPGTLRVRVVERRAVALVGQGGRSAVVDRDGVVIELRDPPPPGLPTVRVARFAAGDPATGAALAVAAELPPGLIRLVSVVHAVSARDVTLNLHDGRTILWGGAERTRTKARVASVLLGGPGRTIDVSAPGAAAVR
ncbi:hypothetical protein Sru01_18240 [Sphaerisporangium rufum]|uniref:Cell division protein FtsQ n=1 Tax=Sphaerisporangium rufum TaxID=1381558 RepID=A0A919V001_9ACTN|nr:FtsQ-type POTRA domain-containing protein [Sphaerisporangium rufum]GII76842.1 hypothetical protein Sru01_18240 [Sphaerisporangium rufum]